MIGEQPSNGRRRRIKEMMGDGGGRRKEGAFLIRRLNPDSFVGMMTDYGEREGLAEAAASTAADLVLWEGDDEEMDYFLLNPGNRR